MKDGMRLIQIAIAILCLGLTATWAWTMQITGRLTKCEVQMSSVVDDIKEIKVDQKELLRTQTEMWKYLREGK